MKKITSLFEACGIIEGFTGESTQFRQKQAWQYIIDTRAYRHLQGFYGRTAAELIRAGVCRPPKGGF
jgi:hypothetical protein